jgi:hypothetical protein
MAETKPVAVVSEKSSFWATLPGILTGAAAVIGAITALVVALRKEPEKPAEIAHATAASMSIPASAPQLQTATAIKGGNAINVSGSGNQISVGK